MSSSSQGHDACAQGVCLEILNELDAFVYVADMDTHELLYANDAVLEFCGLDDWAGQKCWQVLQAGQNGPCSFCTNGQLLEEDGSPAKACEWEFTNTIDGRRYSIRDKAVRWFDGRLVRLEIARDVSRRYQSEQKYKKIFDEAVQGIFQSTPQGIFISVNTAMAKMFGYASPEEMLAEVVRIDTDIYCNPDDRLRLKRILEVDGKVRGFEALCRTRTGEDMWCSETSRAVRDQTGEIVYYEGYVIDITARKQAQMALQESEERHSALSRASFEGILISDRGVVVEANESALEIFGYSSEELLGKNLTALIAPDFRDDFRGRVLRGSEEPYETIAIKANGTPFPVEVRGRMFSYQGRVARVSSVRDITLQKETQTALERSQTWYKWIVENAAEGFVMVSNDLLVDYANAQFALMLGYRIDQVTGVHVGQFFNADGVSIFENNHSSTWIAPESRELQMRKKDGGMLWCRVALSKFVGYEQSKGMLAIVTDLSLYKQAEDALKKSEEVFRGIFELAPEGVALCSPEGVLLRVNSTFAFLLGCSRHEVEGQFLWGFMEQTSSEVFPALYNTLVRGDVEFLRQEANMLLPNGDTCPVKISVSLERDYLGKPVRAFVTLSDISRQKAMEAALKKAKEEAEQTAKGKGLFLANMSHELRVPMNGMFMMLELLKGTELAPQQLRYVQGALETGETLLNVVNDVLDYSKVATGDFSLAAHPFSIADTFTGVRRALEVSARQKGLELKFRLDEGLSDLVLGDDFRLRQIFFNLVGNSIKFSEFGKITVQGDSLGVLPDGGLRVLFSVIDEGCGIPAQMQQHVFEAFEQDSGPQHGFCKGTGLGLGIVRKLVGLMGGHIELDSVPDEGTSIFFTCVFGQPEQGAGDRKNDLSAFDVPIAHGIRVLLVDDEPVTRMGMEHLLARFGYEISVAGDGRTALDILRSEAFDLVLTDIQMPDIGGLDLLREVRSSSGWRTVSDVPFIAMTAHVMPGEREHFLEQGMDGYVAKPVDFNLLKIEMTRALDGGQANDFR